MFRRFIVTSLLLLCFAIAQDAQDENLKRFTQVYFSEIGFSGLVDTQWKLNFSNQLRAQFERSGVRLNPSADCSSAMNNGWVLHIFVAPYTVPNSQRIAYTITLTLNLLQAEIVGIGKLGPIIIWSSISSEEVEPQNYTQARIEQIIESMASIFIRKWVETR